MNDLLVRFLLVLLVFIFIDVIHSVKFTIYNFFTDMISGHFSHAIFLFSGHAVQLVRSQFLNQELNPDHGSESTNPKP